MLVTESLCTVQDELQDDIASSVDVEDEVEQRPKVKTSIGKGRIRKKGLIKLKRGKSR